jgi:hypothetical protein
MHRSASPPPDFACFAKVVPATVAYCSPFSCLLTGTKTGLPKTWEQRQHAQVCQSPRPCVFAKVVPHRPPRTALLFLALPTGIKTGLPKLGSSVFIRLRPSPFGGG